MSQFWFKLVKGAFLYKKKAAKTCLGYDFETEPKLV